MKTAFRCPYSDFGLRGGFRSPIRVEKRIIKDAYMNIRTLLPLAVVFFAVAPASAGTRSLDRAADRITSAITKDAALDGKSAAVIPFKSPDGTISVLAGMFADRLTAGLIKKGGITMVDRRYMGRVMGELKLGASGLTEQRSSAQLGKFTGAQLLLLGSFEVKDDDTLVISARLVEIETGKAVAAAQDELELDKESRALYLRMSSVDTMAEDAFSEGTGDAAFMDREPGPGGCRWVSATASVKISGDPAWARAAALALARQKAVNKGGGRAVPLHMPPSDRPLDKGIEKLLRGERGGSITSESVMDKRGKRDYYASIEACVKPARDNADRDFKVELLLSRNSFKEGETARAVVSVSSAAQIYLYSVDLDGKAGLVFPSGGERNHVEPGRPLIFPDEDGGMMLQAVLPSGSASSVETLRVFAVESSAPVNLSGAVSYPEITARLDASGAGWAEDVRVFSIYK
jgi:TolB-like protein